MERIQRLKSLGESHGMSALAEPDSMDHIRKVWNDMIETYSALAMYKTDDEETRRNDWFAMREGFVSVLNDEAVYFHPEEPVFVAPLQSGERVCYTREFIDELISMYGEGTANGERMRKLEALQGVVIRPGVERDRVVIRWDDANNEREILLHASCLKRIPRARSKHISPNDTHQIIVGDSDDPEYPARITISPIGKTAGYYVDLTAERIGILIEQLKGRIEK